MLDKAWSEAIEGFLSVERAAGKRKATNDQRRQHLQHLARRTTRSPWTVTADDLLDYFAAQTWALETRRARRTTMVRFYAWALDHGRVHTNPAAELPKVRMVPGTPRPAPDAAYHEALMRAKPREMLMLRLAAEVGLRRGEVAVVHTNDLMHDLVGWSLLVHGKGGRDRVVPLPTSLGYQLATMTPGWLFPGNDAGHLSPRYVGKLLRDLMPADWTMHTLRHRFATRLYGLTSDVLLVQQALGHASPVTTQRYVATEQSKMRDAIQRAAEAS